MATLVGVFGDLDIAEDAAQEAFAAAARGDDRLRLIFTFCHPALSMEARVALTLRLPGALTTSEIARALLVSHAAVEQRIVRAKRKIRANGSPYRIPEDHELPGRPR